MADGGIALRELEWALAWNVRGDPARPAFVAEAKRLFGVALPLEPNTTARRGDMTIFWLGPRSWLAATTNHVDIDFDAARAALNAAGGALFDVSAGYVGWTLSGTAAAQILNRSCPLDLDSRVFTAGRCAQSALGHINALISRSTDASEFIVVVARSYAADARHELLESARRDGYRIERDRQV